MRHLSSKQYARAWLEILKSAKDIKLASHGLLFNLYKNGRLNLLPAILMELDELETREKEIIRVLVRSAKEYGRDFIESAVKKLLPGKKTVISKKIDNNLLAGVVVETKNQRWQLNLKYKLDKLARQLQIANHGN